MSYNIDNFKITKLENLQIPIAAFYDKSITKDWLPKEPSLDITTNTLTIRGGAEGFVAIGKNVDGILHVEKINLYGEGSGTFKGYFDNALKKSKGVLEGVMIWEGGDSINSYKVKDGQITEKAYDFE